MSDNTRRILLVLVVLGILGGIYFLQSQSAAPAVSEAPPTISEAPSDTSDTEETVVAPPKLCSGDAQKERQYECTHELIEPNGFVNTDGITLKELIGEKIILVDFWTYSCINCQRTTPFLNAWYDKYRDKGLEIIGVHTPEFEFEKKLENVMTAVKKLGIEYPVAQDNEYKTWRAYKNRYWPRKYLIDIDGYIVYDHIGEGAYEETEAQIQRLLKERLTKLGVEGDLAMTLDMELTANPKEQRKVASPEVYFGASRNELLTNGSPNKQGKQILPVNKETLPNKLYLVGAWDFNKEYARNDSALARVEFLYGANNVFAVASANEEVVVEVRIDNEPVSEKMAGEDIYFEDGKSYMKVQKEQLYKIIDNQEEYSEQVLTLIPQTPGLKMFTFTFG